MVGMIVVFILVGVLVLLGAALLWSGRWPVADSGLQRDPAPTYPAPGSWSATAVTDARFRVGLRGYRMEDVDAMLTSLATQLRQEQEQHTVADGPLDEHEAERPQEQPQAEL